MSTHRNAINPDRIGAEMASPRRKRTSRTKGAGPGTGADRSVAERLREIRDWIDRGGDTDPVALAERLEDSESVLRQAAAWGLGHLKVHESRRALERALKDPDPAVRTQAAGSLGALGNPLSRLPLERALKDPSAKVRERAAWSLWVIADRRSAPPLLARLDDEAADVRWSAAVALGRVGGPEAIDPLTLARGDPNDRVRREALLALAHLRPPNLGELLRPFLADPAMRVRIGAAVGLGEGKDRAAVPMIVERLRVEREVRVLPSLLVALGRIGDPSAVPNLLPFVRHSTSWARVCALHALADLAAPEAADPARELLQDAVWSVRGAAAECLGVVGNSDDRDRLLTLLNDPEMWPRRGAVYALGRLGLVDALPRIRERLGDPDPEVRLAAVWAVGHLGDRESREPLLALLADPLAAPGGLATFAQGDGAVMLQSDAKDRLFDAVVQALGRLHERYPDPSIERALTEARRRLPVKELGRPARLPAPETRGGRVVPTLRDLFPADPLGSAEPR
jgi:HEAT repeat protein